jgi:DNA-binding MarR family transcriptional regulator
MPPKMDIALVELLSEINRKLWKRLGPVARAQGLSLTEMLVLWKVNHRGSYRVTELADDIGLPPSTLTGVADRLTTAGWLERADDPDDRRVVMMRSTPKLADFIASTMRASRKNLAHTFRQLPGELVERLVRDLTVVFDCLEAEEDTKA